MSFVAGDRVIHRFHGVGRVTRLDHLQAQDGTRQCYVVDLGRSLVIWVPIDGSSEQSLRAPLTKEQAAQMADFLRSPARPLDSTGKVRQKQMQDLLRDGSPMSLCALVRDLTAHLASHSPNANDTAVLEQARNILVAEWQLATDEPDAAVSLKALLEESTRSVGSEPG